MLAPQLLLQVSFTSTCFRSEPALDVLVDMPHTDFLCSLVRSNVARVMSLIQTSARLSCTVPCLPMEAELSWLRVARKYVLAAE